MPLQKQSHTNRVQEEVVPGRTSLSSLSGSLQKTMEKMIWGTTERQGSQHGCTESKSFLTDVISL